MTARNVTLANINHLANISADYNLSGYLMFNR